MTHTLNQYLKRVWAAIPLAVIAAFAFSPEAHAAVYGGGGIFQGLGAAAGLGGIAQETSLRALIIRIIIYVLDIILLLAVVAIIVAGIYLIVSNGDEGQKDKAKQIIIYVIVGIVLILLARVIVSWVNNVLG